MLLGGSHGGFIGAHLSMTVPELCCVALRNPVVAVDEMYGVTDIPDWTIVETGGVLEGQWDYLAVTEEQRAAMRAASPLHRLAALPATTRVAPTLLSIGGGDRRVPPRAGQAVVLRAARPKCQCDRSALREGGARPPKPARDATALDYLGGRLLPATPRRLAGAINFFFVY